MGMIDGEQWKFMISYVCKRHSAQLKKKLHLISRLQCYQQAIDFATQTVNSKVVKRNCL